MDFFDANELEPFENLLKKIKRYLGTKMQRFTFVGN